MCRLMKCCPVVLFLFSVKSQSVVKYSVTSARSSDTPTTLPGRVEVFFTVTLKGKQRTEYGPNGCDGKLWGTALSHIALDKWQ